MADSTNARGGSPVRRVVPPSVASPGAPPSRVADVRHPPRALTVVFTASSRARAPPFATHRARAGHRLPTLARDADTDARADADARVDADENAENPRTDETDVAPARVIPRRRLTRSTNSRPSGRVTPGPLDARARRETSRATRDAGATTASSRRAIDRHR